MDELKLARLEGHELKFFEKVEHLDLLIIDDFGMQCLEGQQQNDFEQIIDDRYHRKSLILSSQLAVADWYGVFSNEMLAEACLDRIVHNFPFRSVKPFRHISIHYKPSKIYHHALIRHYICRPVYTSIEAAY